MVDSVFIEIGSYQVKIQEYKDGVAGLHSSIPSFFALDDEGNVHVGNDALRWRFNADFYSLADVEDQISKYGESIQALSKWIKGELSGEMQTVVVIPPYFVNSDPRTEILQRFFAAASCVNSHENLCKRFAYVEDGRGVLVVDIGHQGICVSLYAREGNTFKRKTFYNVKECAGAAMNAALYADVIAQCSPEDPSDIMSRILLNSEMEEMVRFVKTTMVSADTYRCPVPFSNVVYSIDKQRFDLICKEVVSAGLSSCKRFFEQNRSGIESVDEVLFYGGCCHLPQVKALFTQLARQWCPKARITDTFCVTFHPFDTGSCGSNTAYLEF